MGTRFTGRNGTVRVSHETVSRLDTFVKRLRSVGASEDDIAQMRDVWDDPDGWSIPRDTLMALSDVDLRQLVTAANREHYQHTHSPEEEHAERRAAAYSYARAEWAALDKPVRAGEVAQWVGTDSVRAAVALEAETEGQQRVTVLRFLEPLADPDPVPAPDGPAGEKPAGDVPGDGGDGGPAGQLVHAEDGDGAPLCGAELPAFVVDDDEQTTCPICNAKLDAIAAAASGGIEL